MASHNQSPSPPAPGSTITYSSAADTSAESHDPNSVNPSSKLKDTHPPPGRHTPSTPTRPPHRRSSASESGSLIDRHNPAHLGPVLDKSNAFYVDLVSTIADSTKVPHHDKQFTGLVRKTIRGYPKTQRPVMSDKIREQRPRLSAARRIIERDTAKEARQRAEKNTAALDEAWAGRGWMPGLHFLRRRDLGLTNSDDGDGGDHNGSQGQDQGPRQGDGDGAEKPSMTMSFNDKSYMRSLTTLAQKHGIDLPTLWQPGGVLFAAMAEKDAQDPHWFSGVAKRACEILKWRVAQNNNIQQQDPGPDPDPEPQAQEHEQEQEQAQPQAPQPQAPPRQQVTPLQLRDQQEHHPAGHGGQSASSQSPPAEQPRRAAPPRKFSSDLLSSSPLGKVMSPGDNPDALPSSIVAAGILAGIKDTTAGTPRPVSGIPTLHDRNSHDKEDGTRRGPYYMRLTTPDDKSCGTDDDDYDSDWEQVDAGSSEHVSEPFLAPASGEHASFPTAGANKTKDKKKAAAAVAAAMILNDGEPDEGKDDDNTYLGPAASSSSPAPLLPPPQPQRPPAQGSKVFSTHSNWETVDNHIHPPPRTSRATPNNIISLSSSPLPHHNATPSQSPSPPAAASESASSIFTIERLQQVSAEIQQRRRLHGDVIEVGARLVLGLAEKQCGGPDGLQHRPLLMHPLWLQPDATTLPARLPRHVCDEYAGNYSIDHGHSHSDCSTSILYAPMHHSKPYEHWTLATIDTTAGLIQIYDPLPDAERWASIKPVLEDWGRSVFTAARHGENDVRVEMLDGPIQRDGVSCGVFVLLALYRLVLGVGLSEDDLVLQERSFRDMLLGLINNEIQGAPATLSKISRPVAAGFQPDLSIVHEEGEEEVEEGPQAQGLAWQWPRSGSEPKLLAHHHQQHDPATPYAPSLDPFREEEHEHLQQRGEYDIHPNASTRPGNRRRSRAARGVEDDDDLSPRLDPQPPPAKRVKQIDTGNFALATHSSLEDANSVDTTLESLQSRVCHFLNLSPPHGDDDIRKHEGMLARASTNVRHLTLEKERHLEDLARSRQAADDALADLAEYRDLELYLGQVIGAINNTSTNGSCVSETRKVLHYVARAAVTSCTLDLDHAQQAHAEAGDTIRAKEDEVAGIEAEIVTSRDEVERLCKYLKDQKAKRLFAEAVGMR